MFRAALTTVALLSASNSMAQAKPVGHRVAVNGMRMY